MKIIFQILQFKRVLFKLEMNTQQIKYFEIMNE
jgi:hypothetical protein